MQKTTHREYRTWERWLQNQWNQPSRSDYFLMRIAQRVQQVLSLKSGSITLDQQKVGFKMLEPKPEAARAKVSKTKTALSKGRWRNWVGLKKN